MQGNFRLNGAQNWSDFHEVRPGAYYDHGFYEYRSPRLPRSQAHSLCDDRHGKVICIVLSSVANWPTHEARYRGPCLSESARTSFETDTYRRTSRLNSNWMRSTVWLCSKNVGSLAGYRSIALGPGRAPALAGSIGCRGASSVPRTLHSTHLDPHTARVGSQSGTLWLFRKSLLGATSEDRPEGLRH